MHVRDAVEADADHIAAIADAPAEAMRDVVHDRTVRVAAVDEPPTDPNEDNDADPADLRGFVAFDVRDGVVHVTGLGGTADACKRLLEEPMRFAAAEDMPVELLLVDDESTLRDAAAEAGFDAVGDGPRFEGKPTTRYRIERD
ncbi:hypothetical protein [Halobaculum sp. P14]|uniref:hypothetical protein n=1 Tax=Halobaculum sp. P14 TaxID=3421638 RepID=UPI003EBAB4FD